MNRKSKVFLFFAAFLIIFAVSCKPEPETAVPSPEEVTPAPTPDPGFRIADDFTVTPHSGLKIELYADSDNCNCLLYIDGERVMDGNEPLILSGSYRIDENGNKIRTFYPIPTDVLSFGSHTAVIEMVDWNTGKTKRTPQLEFTVGEGITIESALSGDEGMYALECIIDLQEDVPGSETDWRTVWSIKTPLTGGFRKIDLPDGILPIGATDGYMKYTMKAEVFCADEKLFETVKDLEALPVLKADGNEFIMENATDEFSLSVSLLAPYIDWTKHSLIWILNDEMLEAESAVIGIRGGLEYSGENTVVSFISSEGSDFCELCIREIVFHVDEKVPGTQKLENTDGHEIEIKDVPMAYEFMWLSIAGYDPSAVYEFIVDGEPMPFSVYSDRVLVDIRSLGYGRHTMRMDNLSQPDGRGKTYQLNILESVSLDLSPMEGRTVSLDAGLYVKEPALWHDAEYRWKIWLDSESMFNPDCVEHEFTTTFGHLEFTLEDGEKTCGELGVSLEVIGIKSTLENMSILPLNPVLEIRGSSLVAKGETAVFEFVDAHGVLDPEAFTVSWLVDGNETGIEGRTFEFTPDTAPGKKKISAVVVMDDDPMHTVLNVSRYIMVSDSSVIPFNVEISDPLVARGECLSVTVLDGPDMSRYQDMDSYFLMDGFLREASDWENGIQCTIPEDVSWGEKEIMIFVIDRTDPSNPVTYRSNTLRFAPSSSLKIILDHVDFPLFSFHTVEDLEPGKAFEPDSSVWSACLHDRNGKWCGMQQVSPRCFTYDVSQAEFGWTAIFLSSPESGLATTARGLDLTEYFALQGPERVRLGESVSYELISPDCFTGPEFSYEIHWEDKEGIFKPEEKGSFLVVAVVLRNGELWGEVYKNVEVY